MCNNADQFCHLSGVGLGLRQQGGSKVSHNMGSGYLDCIDIPELLSFCYLKFNAMWLTEVERTFPLIFHVHFHEQRKHIRTNAEAMSSPAILVLVTQDSLPEIVQDKYVIFGW